MGHTWVTESAGVCVSTDQCAFILVLNNVVTAREKISYEIRIPRRLRSVCAFDQSLLLSARRLGYLAIYREHSED